MKENWRVPPRHSVASCCSFKSLAAKEAFRISIKDVLASGRKLCRNTWGRYDAKSDKMVGCLLTEVAIDDGMEYEQYHYVADRVVDHLKQKYGFCQHVATYLAANFDDGSEQDVLDAIENIPVR